MGWGAGEGGWRVIIVAVFAVGGLGGGRVVVVVVAEYRMSL